MRPLGSILCKSVIFTVFVVTGVEVYPDSVLYMCYLSTTWKEDQ